jgi:hypothetical protein
VSLRERQEVQEVLPALIAARGARRLGASGLRGLAQLPRLRHDGRALRFLRPGTRTSAMTIYDHSRPISGHTLTLGLLLLATVLVGPARAQQVVVPDTLSSVETRDIAGRDLAKVDTWYVRGFDSLFGFTKSEDDRASRGEPVRIADEFRPYEGLRIREIRILARESFGTVVTDTSGAETADIGSFKLMTTRLERAMNALAWSTKESTIRSYLLFAEGDEINPFALADSERLIRRRKYITDAKIEVYPLEDEPGWADVVVLARDRWPLGVKAKIITAKKYRLEFYHRNLLGRGLNFEYEFRVREDKDPSLGYRARASFENVAGSFVDTSIQRRDDWEYEEWDLSVSRDFLYPDIRALGGVNYRHRLDRNVDELPEGVDLETATIDSWVGWNFSLRQADDYGKKRIRLVPAFRHEHTDFLNPPRDQVEEEDPEEFWRDNNLYLSQLSLLAVDYHAANLVYSYGETEDVPSGSWVAPVFGGETTELRDRLYHAIGVAWTTFTEHQRFMYAKADYGGWRNRGRFEDGALNLAVGGFSSLTERSYGYWRHFARLNYSLGINRTDTAGLRLDEVALRDLDSSDIAGDHRLTLMLESLLFTRYSFLGFKAAAFAYASGGFVGPEDEALLDERFSTNVGIGIRLNNPLLAIPTTEARVGLLSTADGVEASFYIRMKDVSLFREGLPSVIPNVFGYE